MNKCLDRLGHCIRYLWRIDILHNASLPMSLGQTMASYSHWPRSKPMCRLDQCYHVARIYILDLISSESALSFSISPEVAGQLMPRPSVSFGFGI
jgi:hypothetical protein